MYDNESVLSRTVACRADEIDFNCSSQFKIWDIFNGIADVKYMAQIVLSIRGINFGYDLTRELADLIAPQDTTEVEVFFKFKCVTMKYGW